MSVIQRLFMFLCLFVDLFTSGTTAAELLQQQILPHAARCTRDDRCDSAQDGYAWCTVQQLTATNRFKPGHVLTYLPTDKTRSQSQQRQKAGSAESTVSLFLTTQLHASFHTRALVVPNLHHVGRVNRY